MDTVKSNNERELTSTMGNVLSTSSKDEKNDTSDATPTSSTDANTTSTASQIVSDDPISSTSSDIVENNKTKATEASMQNSVDVGQTASDEPDKSSTDHEADLLEMSISTVPNEKITEDVEDLVHDLESLLGESTDSFNVPIKRKDDRKSLDAKEVQPQTLPVADPEILPTGDLISIKDDVKHQNLDTTDTEKTKEISGGDQLDMKNNKLQTLEDAVGQDKPKSNTIDEKAGCNKEESNEDNPSSSKDASADPEHNTGSEVVEDIKSKEECSVEADESKIEVTESVTEAESKDVQVDNVCGEKIETENENPKENTQNNTENELVANEKLFVQEKENEPSTEIDVCEEKAKKDEDVTKQDRTLELKDILVTTAENIESTIVVPECDTEAVKDSNTQVQNDVESKIDLKDIEETIEALPKNEERTDTENTETVEPLEGLKIPDTSVIEGQPSGDHKLDENAPKIDPDMVANKDSSGVPKIEASENSNSCTSSTQENEESLEVCEAQQELIETVKEKVGESHTKEAIKDQITENLIEMESEETRPEPPRSNAGNNVDVELTKKDVTEESSSAINVEMSEDVADEQTEGDIVHTEAVSNILTKESTKNSSDKIDEIIKPIIEDSDGKPKEDVTDIKLPKEDTSKDESNSGVTESPEGIPESVKEVIPEEGESRSDVNETVLISETSQKLSEDTSDVQNKAMDSTEETPVETEDVESPVTENVPETSDVVIEVESEGIVSEPEQMEENPKEVSCESEVEIVEITDEAETKLTENQEVFEGVVTDGEEPEPEKSCGIVGDIPEIVVEPPEDVEPKTESDVCIEKLQPEVQSDNVKASEPEIVSDTVTKQTASEAEIEADKTHEKFAKTSLLVPEDEHIHTEALIAATNEVEQMPENEAPIEDKSDRATIKPKDFDQAPKSPEGTSKNKDTLKADEETPESVNATPTMGCVLSEQVEEDIKPIDNTSIINVITTETPDINDGIPRPDIETTVPCTETSISSECAMPIDNTCPKVETTKLTDDETAGTVDENPATVDETRSIADETASTMDETVTEIDTVKLTKDVLAIPVEDSHQSDIDETQGCSEETRGSIEEAASLKPEIDETIVTTDESTTSNEISQPIDETPTSSAETGNNSSVPDDSTELLDSRKELPEITDESTKGVDAASNVASVEESLEAMEEASDCQAPEPVNECVEIVMDNITSEVEGIVEQNPEVPVVPTSETDDEVVEKQEDNKVIEISDDDSKAVDSEEKDFVQVLSSSGESDSEEMVPVLALEPDENIPISPKESMGVNDDSEIETPPIVHSMDVASVPEPLPEIEDILADQGQVDEEVVAIDLQENLETILAVASLQNADSTEADTVVEPQISEKERREMEALRKAVESITENPAIELEEEVDNVVGELIKDADIPMENNLVEDVTVEEQEEIVITNVENEFEEVISKKEIITIEDNDDVGKVEQIESDTDQDVPELRIEDSEDAQEIEENVVEENVVKENVVEENVIEENVELKEDVRVRQTYQTLPDTSENIDNENKGALPDSSQVLPISEEVKRLETPKETKNRNNERPRRHKKSVSDNKLEELSINVDVPDKDKPYSPKVTIKPIKVPDDEVSTTSNSDSEVGKGSLKMTITKQSDKMHSILKICDPETSEVVQELDEPIPKLIIKPKMQQVEQQHSPKMSTRSSKQMYSPTSSTQRSGSPRITIKPVVKPEKGEPISPLKIKIKPEDISKKHNPKVNIRPITKPEEESPVQTTRKVIIKPVVKPVDEPEQVHSPRITIKPIPKPESEKESVPTTPRLNIKPIKKQDDESEVEKERSSPKITIKPIVKPQEPDTQTSIEEEEIKERIVLKINKGNLPTPTKDPKKREHPPDEDKSEKLAKITVKFSKGGGHAHIVQQCEESNKRVHEEQVTPEKSKKQKTDGESPMSTRSKHKENLGESPVETRSKHKETPCDNPSSESSKSKQKDLESPSHELSRSKHKDPIAESPIEPKRIKMKETAVEVPIYESTRSRHREVSESSISEGTRSKHKEHNAPDKVEPVVEDPDVRIVETKLDSPIVISEDSRSQDSGSCVIIEDVKDPLAAIPVFEIRAEPKAMTPKQDTPVSAPSTPSTPLTPTPRKRGRPRKVPIVVREEFKEQEEPKPDTATAPKEEEPKPAPESGRPKRSCRGQSARATLGIKPRKPRGPGRGRGSKRGMGTRTVPMKPESEPKLSKAKLKLMQESIKEEIAKAKTEEAEHEKETVLHCLLSNIEIKAPVPVLAPPETLPVEVPASPSASVPVPSPQAPVASPVPAPAASPKPTIQERAGDLSAGENSVSDSVTPSTSNRVSGEIVMVDEETRMSADTNSRAQTPAKQVPADVVIEESQSSVQSTATTESGKAASSRPNKAPRLEVQEPEGAVISADQLTEYYWSGNGPFMLQEQVAQFLGIKSFKRKYPGIMRRMLDMQERDFIRESGLASEHMCDLGLTAVNSADILDIMYSDFQEKYEEYCKHQRDRQAKELINKQRALSLAASQEKNKADITEQAVQSAALWNASFNKTRKEQRKACMDLQTLTVHYPKGKLKQINKAKVGNYPVALVPGQFTDYYQEFTPTEINNLPINTMCYDSINIIPPEESDDSGSEGSDSDSDSSSSSSGSGSDSSSGVEDCKLCKHSPKKVTPTK